MAPSTTWLSITDLGRIYGLSSTHCGKALQKRGWRDEHGLPTQGALEAGAASTNGPHNHQGNALWNVDVCRGLLEKTCNGPLNRSIEIDLWVKLLETLNEGSPSINTTADQMAEELPADLVKEVNSQLAIRGCDFRVNKTANSFAHSHQKSYLGA